MTELPEVQHHLRRAESQQRLALTTSIAAVVVALVLVLVPVTLVFVDLPDERDVLEVDIVSEQPVEARVPEPVAEEVPEVPVDEAEPEPQRQAAEAPANAEAASEPPVDWQEMLASYAERSEEFVNVPAPSMSPEFDEKRRVAALHYAKPQTREKKPIWENTETDQMGRTILRSGNCYRVIAEPSAVRQWEFETFGQYFVYCESGKVPPVELPWVADVVALHGYLQEDRKYKDN